APFSPSPSVQGQVVVAVVDAVPDHLDALGVLVGPDGAPPAALGSGRDELTAAGFTGALGTTLVVPRPGSPTVIAVGTGPDPDGAALRDAAAAFASASSPHAAVGLDLTSVTLAGELAGEAAVEGVVLARYAYDVLRREPAGRPVTDLVLVTSTDRVEGTRSGAARGRVLASATELARDLANTPHSHLTATRLAEIAVSLGAERGLDVEVFDADALREMQVGGLLAINQGSSEPPRMVRITYRPDGDPAGRLAIVGKGIMYDSGGLGIKPNDRIHAQMKNDMSGAAAALAAMAVLRDLGCRAEVTAYLMCTDNMPSGTAIALGDVITIRGGTTVEVMDTDAEGRVVMSDALVLATEDGVDAVIDIATLTGSALRALGSDMAALLGNHDEVLAQVEAAAVVTGEPVWRLPLHRRYRRQLDSLTADVMNVGYGDAGAITAALFLAEFVGDTPWAHIDMCGPAQVDDGRSWLPAGCSGFGARLLAQVAVDFRPPAA
ncbi:MAG TPA: leucyl aminopeptidase family protein, partial [Acidimicrobiales bacterium]|nr:leucyl aminopeptidase family protein [Acidimicrobiales bacterium]